jgi:hypothetical protein
VVIHNKTARRVAVRIPWWVMRRELRAAGTGIPHALSSVGNYMVFDDLRPGDNITLEFPVQETTGHYTVNAKTAMEQTYTCSFWGSTLVAIAPRDEAPTSYPLYLRDHLKTQQTPMKTTTRFVPKKVIETW